MGRRRGSPSSLREVGEGLVTLIVLASESERVRAAARATSRVGEGWSAGAGGPKGLWEELVQQAREWEQWEVEVLQEQQEGDGRSRG